MSPVERLAAAALALSLTAAQPAAQPGAQPGGNPAAPPPPIEPREAHLAELRQLTFGGENAEGYWSSDGTELIFQSQRPPYACDQIFRARADGSGEPALVSTGKGRTTCSYFLPDGRVIYSSTHA